MKLYYISGLGANEKAFSHIEFPSQFEKIFLPWIQPNVNEDLENYAKRMAKDINENEDFYLVGLSFGGIMAQEINRIKPAKKVIIISSIKNHDEKPLFMHFSKRTWAHKLIPTSFFTSDKLVSYAFFRNLYSNKLPSLNDIFEYRDSYYLKWSINQIIHWKPTYSTKNIIHIHGDKDPVFPFHKIKNPILVKGGNHIMIIQKSKKINEILKDI